ncbi:MAG TPA: hypothetical protein VFP20_09645 [Bacteroidales bacterium]|nr:hypothetical protein [Bacteroidales bacterium]
MKSKGVFFSFIFSLLLLFNTLQAQRKVELSAGLGMPELMYVGFDVGQKVQYGAKFGLLGPYSWFGDEYYDWSIGANIRFHFAGKSKFVGQAPWYISGDLLYHDLSLITMGNFDYEGYSLSFNPRIGRTINFSEKIGANIDFGLFLPLRIRYNPNVLHVYLSGSLSLFIRM